MSFGKAGKPCVAYKYWPSNPGLCGVCAWEKDEHNGAHVKSNLQPHQIRVVHELRDLEERRENLHIFIDSSPIYKALDKDEQGRLRSQSNIMGQYVDILRMRIKVFLG